MANKQNQRLVSPLQRLVSQRLVLPSRRFVSPTHPASPAQVSASNKASFEVEDEREFFSAASSELPKVLSKLEDCSEVGRASQDRWSPSPAPSQKPRENFTSHGTPNYCASPDYRAPLQLPFIFPYFCSPTLMLYLLLTRAAWSICTLVLAHFIVRYCTSGLVSLAFYEAMLIFVTLNFTVAQRLSLHDALSKLKTIRSNISSIVSHSNHRKKSSQYSNTISNPHNTLVRYIGLVSLLVIFCGCSTSASETVSCLRNACQVSSFEVEENSWVCRRGYYPSDEATIDVRSPHNVEPGGRGTRERIKRFVDKSPSGNGGDSASALRKRRFYRDASAARRKQASLGTPMSNNNNNKEFDVGDFDDYSAAFDDISLRGPHATPYRSASFQPTQLDVRQDWRSVPSNQYGERILVTDQKLDDPELIPWSPENRDSVRRGSSGSFLNSGRVPIIHHPEIFPPVSRSGDRSSNEPDVFVRPGTHPTNSRNGGRYPSSAGGRQEDFKRRNQSPGSRVSATISVKEVSCKPAAVKLSSVDQVCSEQLADFAHLVRKM